MYTELRGGEPGAEAVEFVANEPRIPQIQENIVTLDLTDGAWEPVLQDDQPRIERTDLDITPHLRTVASQLYTGELGYFVVNVPDQWEDEMLRPRFFERLAARLADTELTGLDDETGGSWINRLNEAPVLLAEPRVDDAETFRTLVRRYYSLNADFGPVQNRSSQSKPTEPQKRRVPQIEAVQERALRQNDANRILLTKRQPNDGESDSHYLWKAAIVDGLAKEMHACSPESDRGFDDFLEEHLLTGDIINTEQGEEDDVHPDISVSVGSTKHPEWVSAALDEFLPNSLKGPNEVVIEFETGRSEGAFNFRKFRKSIEKYSENEERPVCLVVPTRLLFRGEKRARMILRIVTTTKEDDELPSVEVAVPTLTRGQCRRLQPARSVVEAIYGGGGNDT